MPLQRSRQISSKALPKPSDNCVAQFGDGSDAEARVAAAERRQAEMAAATACSDPSS